MIELIFFLAGVVIISLSGVMAPGPVTAAAIATGTRSRHGGALIAAGHGIVEFPLIFLIVAGMNKFFASSRVQLAIGLAGGIFLLVMALQMLQTIRNSDGPTQIYGNKGPILTGIILSAGNPYFLLWWATVGLALATKAQSLGVFAFVLFAVVHWCCDLVWLELLSWASFKGSKLLSIRSQRIILTICTAALFLFGVMFIGSAYKKLLQLSL